MKKPSIFSFLITLLLAAAICTQAQEPVLDTDGNPVQLRAQYLIQPVNNNGGDLVPTTILSSVLPFCPFRITQQTLPSNPGMPVSFYVPFSPRNLAPVRTTGTVFISFRSDYWPFCNQFSQLLKVGEPSTEEPALLMGGCLGERNSMFKIVKEAGANTYKLTTFAGTVGTIDTEYIKPLLVVTNDTAKTLLVKFSKVDDATAAATSTSLVEKLGRTMFPSY